MPLLVGLGRYPQRMIRRVQLADTYPPMYRTFEKIIKNGYFSDTYPTRICRVSVSDTYPIHDTRLPGSIRATYVVARRQEVSNLYEYMTK
jgi:hypothetical protein